MANEDLLLAADFNAIIGEFKRLQAATEGLNKITAKSLDEYKKFDKVGRGTVSVLFDMKSASAELYATYRRFGQTLAEVSGLISTHNQDLGQTTARLTTVRKGTLQAADATKQLAKQLAAANVQFKNIETFTATRKLLKNAPLGYKDRVSPKARPVYDAHSSRNSREAQEAEFERYLQAEAAKRDAEDQNVIGAALRQYGQRRALANVGNRALDADRAAAAAAARQQAVLQALGNKAVRGDVQRATGFTFKSNVPISREMINASRAVETARAKLAKFNEEAENTRSIFSRAGFLQTAKFYAFYRAMTFVKDGMVDTARAALDMTNRIREILTITQGSGYSFEKFADQIFTVSDAFGLQAEDVAEATYEAISNQVVDAADSMQFLAESAKFARVTNSNLEDSVNLLSSVIKSYSLDVSEAERVSATLFRTIDLGRVRANEIANSLGSVTATSSILGINIEEVGAALATLTVNGIKANEAITLLRNVNQKLIKPTKEMKELLHEWGYESGQAAVQANGLTGVIAKMAEQADGSAEVFGDLLSRVRAITGGVILAGDGVKSLTITLDKFQGSIQAFRNAKLIALDENAAVTVEQQVQTIRNSFIKLGIDGIKVFSKINKNFIQLTSAAKILGAFILFLTVRFVGLQVEISLAAVQLAVANARAIAAAQGMVGLRLALVGVGAAAKASVPALIALAVTLATAAWANAKIAAEEFRQELELNTSEAVSEISTAISNDLIGGLEELRVKFRDVGKEIATYRKQLTDLLDAQNDVNDSNFAKFLDILESGLNGIKDSSRAAKDAQRELTTAIRESGNEAEQAQKKYEDYINALADEKFNKQVAEASSPEEEAKLRGARIAENKVKISDLRAKKTKEAFAEAERLAKQILEDEKRIFEIRGGSKGVATPAATRAKIELDRALTRLDQIKEARTKGLTPKAAAALDAEEKTILGKIPGLRAATEERAYAPGERTDKGVKSAEKFVSDILLDAKNSAEKTKATNEASLKVEEGKEKSLDKQEQFSKNLIDSLKEAKKQFDKGKITAQEFAGQILAGSLLSGIPAAGLSKGVLSGADLEKRVSESDKTARSVAEDIKNRETFARALIDRTRSKQEAQKELLAGSLTVGGVTAPIRAKRTAEEFDFALREEKRVNELNASLESGKSLAAARGEKLIAARKRRASAEEVEKLLTPSEDELKAFSTAGRLAQELSDNPKTKKFISGDLDSIIGIGKLADALTNGANLVQPARSGEQGDPQRILDVFRDAQKNVIRDLRPEDKALAEQIGKSVGLSAEQIANVFKAPQRTINDFNFQIQASSSSLSHFSSEVLAAAERLKSLRASRGASASSAVSDAIENETGLPGIEGKASGGYGPKGGIFHRGEFVVNPKSTAKYRQLLELLNSDGRAILAPRLHEPFELPSLRTPFRAAPSFGPSFINPGLGPSFIHPGLLPSFTTRAGISNIRPGLGSSFIQPGLQQSFVFPGTSRTPTPGRGPTVSFGNINVDVRGVDSNIGHKELGDQIAAAVRREIVRGNVRWLS